MDSRSKGQRGERELLAELSRVLDVDLTRNLAQSRDGGADCIDLGAFSIEVKRAERFRSEWLKQTERQANERIPVLAWRANRASWRILPVLTVERFAAWVRRLEE